jgi:hypothetical protein
MTTPSDFVSFLSGGIGLASLPRIPGCAPESKEVSKITVKIYEERVTFSRRFHVS